MKSFLSHARAILLLLICLAAAALSGATVGKVKFEQRGSAPIAEELLQHNIRLRPGSVYTREILDGEV